MPAPTPIRPPQFKAEETVRVRFQGYAPISIPSYPQAGLWSPGYYRTIPRELAEQLLWLHRPAEGEEPDFAIVDTDDNQEPTENTRQARLSAVVI